jgi:lipase chaperone LimK
VLSSVALVATVFLGIMLTRPAEHIPPKVMAEPDMFAFVHSMTGTRPDGNLTVTADDALVADVELRRMFDYYLGAIGEKNIDQIRAEIELELDRKLKPVPAVQAKRLLTRYIDYKRALVDVEKNPQTPSSGVGTVRARLLAMQQMRARFFTPKEVESMFGFDDAYDTDAVARLEINQDAGLSAAQKKVKLAALDAAMSPALREAREAPLKVARMEESAQKMRAGGASEDDVYRMRAKAFSPEAAARLAAVDQETLNWKNRIASYLAARNNLIGNPTLSDADRQTALQQLRDAQFSADEQKRLAAYE